MIKYVARAVIKSISRLTPAGILRRAARKNLVTFCYHVVSNYSIPHIKYYAYKNRAQFEADIIYLKKNFMIASYDDFIHAARSGTRPKDKLALVTIDDGLAQCFTDIRPVLLRHKVPGVFFIATDYIDNTRLLPEQKASLCIDILQRAANLFPFGVPDPRDALRGSCGVQVVRQGGGGWVVRALAESGS